MAHEVKISVVGKRGGKIAKIHEKFDTQKEAFDYMNAAEQQHFPPVYAVDYCDTSVMKW